MANHATPEKITLPDRNLGERPFTLYIPENVINERTDALAKQVLTDYDSRPIHVIGVALGGIYWTVDFSRALRRNDPSVNLTMDIIRLSSYSQATRSSGVVRVLSDLGMPELMQGRNVIIVDEIVDSGLSISHMRRIIEAGVRDSDARIIRPASLAIASLTDKPSAHNLNGPQNTSLELNYVGFAVPDIWLVGQGMDHEQRGREIPAIYRSTTPADPNEVPAYTMPATISPFQS